MLVNYRRQLRGKHKEQKIMAEYKVNDAVLNIAQSVREAGQTVNESAAAAYERNVAFVQSTLENGVEVLKSHAESTRSLMREQTEHAQDQQPVDVQTLFNSAIAAQERNLHYAQTTFENGAELWKKHVSSTRALLDKLAEQGQRQQELVRQFARESADAYVDFFFTPLSYYKQAIDTAESIAWQGVETAEKVGRQGIETAQKASRQSFEAAQQVVNQGQKVAQQSYDAAQRAFSGLKTPEPNNQ